MGTITKAAVTQPLVYRQCTDEFSGQTDAATKELYKLWDSQSTAMHSHMPRQKAEASSVYAIAVAERFLIQSMKLGCIVVKPR